MLKDNKIEYTYGITTISTMLIDIKTKLQECIQEVVYSDESITETKCSVLFSIPPDTRKYKIELTNNSGYIVFSIYKMSIDGVTVYDKESPNSVIYDPETPTTSSSKLCVIQKRIRNNASTYIYLRVIEGKYGSRIITLMGKDDIGYGIKNNCLKIFKIIDIGTNTEKVITAMHYFYRREYQSRADRRYAFVDQNNDPIKINGEYFGSSESDVEINTNANIYELSTTPINIGCTFGANSVITPIWFLKTSLVSAFSRDVFCFKDIIGQNFGVMKTIINGVERTFYKFEDNMIIEI